MGRRPRSSNAVVLTLVAMIAWPWNVCGFARRGTSNSPPERGASTVARLERATESGPPAEDGFEQYSGHLARFFRGERRGRRCRSAAIAFQSLVTPALSSVAGSASRPAGDPARARITAHETAPPVALLRSSLHDQPANSPVPTVGLDGVSVRILSTAPIF